MQIGQLIGRPTGGLQYNKKKKSQHDIYLNDFYRQKKNCTKRKNYETYSTQNFAVKPEFSANALTACIAVLLSVIVFYADLIDR